MEPADGTVNAEQTAEYCTDGMMPLLALYPNLRQTGWAVFTGRDYREPPAPAASGTAGPRPRTRMEPQQRISRQLLDLTAIAERWQPRYVVCSWAGGMNWSAPGMFGLQEELRRWAGSIALPVSEYPAPQVRATIAGKPNASRDALAYSVMARLNLIGEFRSAPECEAIAAGYHHLWINWK